MTATVVHLLQWWTHETSNICIEHPMMRVGQTCKTSPVDVNQRTRFGVAALAVLCVSASACGSDEVALTESSDTIRSVQSEPVVDEAADLPASTPMSSIEQFQWMEDWWNSLTRAEQQSYCTLVGEQSEKSMSAYMEWSDGADQLHAQLVLDGTVVVEQQYFVIDMSLNCG